MSKHARTKLVTQNMRSPEKQSLEAQEESSLSEQKENLVLSELDMEIECPRCNDVMELNSNFDTLVYFCDSCSFVLKCV
jgi:Zn finger protein HypA/HybF involved in hydrogenase expression